MERALRSLPEPIVSAIASGRVASPPQVLLRLLRMVDDDGATMVELAELIERDPGLCARILTAANSPALRRGNPLHSMENCLVALGTRLVRSIATCLSVQSMFERHSGAAAPDLAAFWTHSLLVAELSRELASASACARPDEAYLAGLLHDVGELILLAALGVPYARLLAACTDEDTLPAMENETLGTHHGEIGTWLVDQWQLDSAFADGILFHHVPAPQIVSAAPLPQLVWLAHALTGAGNFPAEGQSDGPAGIPSELSALAETMFGPALAARLASLREQAERQTRQVGEALGIAPPARRQGDGAWGLPQLPPQLPQPPADASAAAAAAEIDAHIGGLAAMQPLQQELLDLEDDAELLLALRESARILFDLNRLAFLRHDPRTGKLSGAGIDGQPPIFRQVDIPLEAHRSLAASAALARELRSTFDARPRDAESLIDAQFARAFATEGLLCVPMATKKRTFGVMVAGLGAAQYTRLARHLSWLLDFGRIAAMSLESLHAAQDCRRQAEDEAGARFARQARRVVHEAGNPLGIIKSYLKILDTKLPGDAGVRQELEVLSEEIDRVAGIVRRMSEIPAAPLVAGGLDVGELLREMLALYGEALLKNKGIALETQLPAKPLRVACERDGLKQIILNLWKNAAEALSAGERFSIAVSDRVIHDGRAFVEIRMDDTGPGMPEAALRRLRGEEDAGAGPRGLGLSIVRVLARRQGIVVTCRSRAGEGTSIALLLPEEPMKDRE